MESGDVRSRAKMRRGVFTAERSSSSLSRRLAITHISSKFSDWSSCSTNSRPSPLDAPVTIAISISVSFFALSAFPFFRRRGAARA